MKRAPKLTREIKRMTPHDKIKCPFPNCHFVAPTAKSVRLHVKEAHDSPAEQDHIANLQMLSGTTDIRGG